MANTNWLSLTAAILQKVEDARAVCDAITYYFDIDNAFGMQLDVIGQIVGQGRTVDFNPTDGTSPVLDDDTYKILLKATIAKNHWDGKEDSLYPIWNSLFPGGTILIIDGQSMNVNINVTGSFSQTIVDLINNDYIVPRPQGVNYTFGFGDLPYFGYDRNDSFISGYDAGTWI